MNSNHTYLLALLVQVVDSLACRLCCRTHEDDYVLCVLSSVVVEEVILATCDLCHLLAVLLYYLRDAVVVLVASLTVCEECLRVLCCTACNRALRCECTVAETLDVVRIYQRTDVFHIHLFDLVVLV